MKYEDIKKANETIMTIDVKGKNKRSSSMIKYWDNKRKPRLQKNGYLTICIANKKYYIHRLIMEQSNKTSDEVQKKIKKLRQNGYYLKDICKIVNLSYPTVLKYAKGVK